MFAKQPVQFLNRLQSPVLYSLFTSPNAHDGNVCRVAASNVSTEIDSFNESAPTCVIQCTSGRSQREIF